MSAPRPTPQGSIAQPIDIVIPWVDGSDGQWRQRRDQYSGNVGASAREVRFRDWGTLRFVLRGIDAFMPWVRRIHLVTEGHTPDWIVFNDRLRHVKHEDYIPAKYLPTFNVNTIEMNIHRIPGLADRFIYFNDDTLVVRPIPGDAMFAAGLPCDEMVLNRITGSLDDVVAAQIWVHDMCVLNDSFDTRAFKRAHRAWFFDRHYSLRSRLRSAQLLAFPEISNFLWHHNPSPLLRSTLVDIWEAYPEILDASCRTKFRAANNVNQYLARGWQYLTGNFAPRDISTHSRVYHGIARNLPAIARDLGDRSITMICLNDDASDAMEPETISALHRLLEARMPSPSVFEK